MVVVDDLHPPVLPARRSEEGGVHAPSGKRLPGCDQRRPEARTLSVAGAPAVRVLLEEVERVPARVDEDLPEGGRRDRDHGPLRSGVGVNMLSARPIAATAAAIATSTVAPRVTFVRWLLVIPGPFVDDQINVPNRVGGRLGGSAERVRQPRSPASAHPVDLLRRRAFSWCVSPASRRASRHGLITIGASRPRSRCFFIQMPRGRTERSEA